MPRYQLFAARDGDTFIDISNQPDIEAAELWAKGQIVEAFGIQHLHDCDYDEIVAETDGVNLDVLLPDPVAAFVMNWLMTQAQLIEPLLAHFNGKFAPQLRSYRGGILDLFLAVQQEHDGTEASASATAAASFPNLTS